MMIMKDLIIRIRQHRSLQKANRNRVAREYYYFEYNIKIMLCASLYSELISETNNFAQNVAHGWLCMSIEKKIEHFFYLVLIRCYLTSF